MPSFCICNAIMEARHRSVYVIFYSLEVKSNEKTMTQHKMSKCEILLHLLFLFLFQASSNICKKKVDREKERKKEVALGALKSQTWHDVCSMEFSQTRHTYTHGIYHIINSLFWPSHILGIKSSVWPEESFIRKKESGAYVFQTLFITLLILIIGS